MCNVNTVGLGLQTGYELSGLNEKYQKNQMQMNYQTEKNNAILENLVQNSRELNNSYASDYESNVMKRQQNYINSLQAKSTIQASLASKGINSSSISNLYKGYDRALAVNNYLSARDLQTRGLQYNYRLDSLRRTALNSLDTYYPYQNTLTSTLFGGAYNLLNKYQNNTKNQSL